LNDSISSQEKRAISFVLIGALLLRLYTLGSESFWLDEAIVWHRVKDGPLSFLFDWDADTQGPTYSLLIWIWSKLFGFGEIAMRMPSVIFGVLGIHAMYLLGRRVFGHQAAIWAALYATVNPFLMYYSQEARPYTLWFWTSLLAVWYLLRLIERHSRVNVVGVIVFTLLSLYTHPYGPFLLALQAALIAVMLPRSEWKRFVKPALIIGVAYLPEGLVFLWAFLGKVENKWTVAAWINRPDLSAPWQYMRYYFAWDLLALASSAALIGGLIVYRKRLREFKTGWLVCGAIVFGFFVLPWLVSQIVPILWMRYTITVIAAVLLPLGWITAQTKRPLQIVAVGLFLIGSALPLYHYYTDYDKDPWRQAIGWFTPRVQASDHIIVHPLRAPMPFEYYYNDLTKHTVVVPRKSEDVPTAVPDSGTVWFVAATYSHSKPLRDELYAELARRCDCDSTYKTAALFPRNPFLIFRGEIEITRCRVREQRPVQL